MTRGTVLSPSNDELRILQVLWDNGSGTVRTVWEALGGRHDVGYTTILKFRQIMTEKGLVSRWIKERAHVYKPLVGEEVIQRERLSQLLNEVYRGSADRLTEHLQEFNKLQRSSRSPKR